MGGHGTSGGLGRRGALGSPAFQKIVADVPNFATGGATIVAGQIE
jgi:hypothetical protein